MADKNKFQQKKTRWLPKPKMAAKVFSEQLHSYAKFRFQFGGESDLNWLSYGNFKIDCSHVSRRVSRRTGENYPILMFPSTSRDASADMAPDYFSQ